VEADSRERQRHDLSFLSDVRVHFVLGERRVSRARQRCHWQFRRPDFPGADPRSVGDVAPPVGYLASRHAAEALGQAGMTRSLSEKLGNVVSEIRVRAALVSQAPWRLDLSLVP